VVFTFDLDALPAWQLDYLGDALELERSRFGTPERVAQLLGGRTRIERLPTPADCTDGFFEAFWNRPEALLDAEVRSAQSIWALTGPELEQGIVKRLALALESGDWDRQHGHLREQQAFEGGLRLVVSEPA
jgi:hypothetical protein